MSRFGELPEYIVIPMEDELVHTAENGYCCGDPDCYCAAGDNRPDLSLTAEEPLDTIGMLN